MRKPLVSKVFVFSLVFTSASCASYFKKKECEKTNWFNHGQSIAMRGERVDSDTFVGECKKVEAKMNFADLDLGFKKGMETYCKPQTVLNLGKKGEFFKSDMCDGGSLRKLKKKHEAGVRQFCKVSNGFKVGASGRVYNNICPESLEKAFLSKYNKGRRKFLRVSIGQKKRQIDEIDDKIEDLRRDKNDKMLELRTLGSGKVMTRKRVYDPATRTYKEETKVFEDEETQRKKRDIKWDVDRIEGNVKKARKEKADVRGEIRDLEKELASLSEGEEG